MHLTSTRVFASTSFLWLLCCCCYNNKIYARTHRHSGDSTNTSPNHYFSDSNNDDDDTSANSEAEPIALVAQHPQTLKQIYDDNSNSNSFFSPPVQKVFKLVFAQEPARWDPRQRPSSLSASSEFKWGSIDSMPADNAYIKVLGGAGPYHAPKAYASSDATLISAPFKRWSPLSANDPDPYFEGDLLWKNNASVGRDERIVARLWMKCKVLYAEQHPFPDYLVTHTDDDPRLANCHFGIAPASVLYGNVTTYFYFSITNKSIWAAYNAATFIARRRVGVRQSYNDLADIAIEYNAMLNQITYYVSGQPVWIITALGLPPPRDDGLTKIDFGRVSDAQLQSLITSLTFYVGTEKCLDESDPWNQADATRLVKTHDNDEFFGNNAKFYDPNNLRSNVLWGQTVKQTLQKVVILRTSASAPAAAVSTPAAAQTATRRRYYDENESEKPDSKDDVHNEPLSATSTADDDDANIQEDYNSFFQK